MQYSDSFDDPSNSHLLIAQKRSTGVKHTHITEVSQVISEFIDGYPAQRCHLRQTVDDLDQIELTYSDASSDEVLELLDEEALSADEIPIGPELPHVQPLLDDEAPSTDVIPFERKLALRKFPLILIAIQDQGNVALFSRKFLANQIGGATQSLITKHVSLLNISCRWIIEQLTVSQRHPTNLLERNLALHTTSAQTQVITLGVQLDPGCMATSLWVWVEKREHSTSQKLIMFSYLL